MNLKVFITGTRGIPNRYGGFEQFAEKLSALLVQKGVEVSVFNPHYHSFRGEKLGQVNLIRVRNFEKYLGFIGTLLYDFQCMRKAYRQKDAVVLLCGYGSAFLVNLFFSKQKRRTIVHMDGLEWQRSKWNWLFRWILKRMEQHTALRFPHLVVDHPMLKEYYQDKYRVVPHVISYGAEVSKLSEYQKEHYLVIARLEPENNLEIIINGYLLSGVQQRLVVVGDLTTRYAKRLLKKYGKDEKIVFAGGIYDTPKLRELRQKSILYFHGHSVGGTNPSLLEAMGDGCLIAAHDNPFNREVLLDFGYYFKTEGEVKKLISEKERLSENYSKMIDYVQKNYAWEAVADKFLRLLSVGEVRSERREERRERWERK